MLVKAWLLFAFWAVLTLFCFFDHQPLFTLVTAICLGYTARTVEYRK